MSYVFDNAFESFMGLEKTARARWKRELINANKGNTVAHNLLTKTETSSFWPKDLGLSGGFELTHAIGDLFLPNEGLKTNVLGALQSNPSRRNLKDLQMNLKLDTYPTKDTIPMGMFSIPRLGINATYGPMIN